MKMKIIAALIALALVLAYLLPPVFKLKEIDLGIAILIGVAMIAVDLWQSLRSGED